eukprot:4270275-Karenia_brevis.AAC.1
MGYCLHHQELAASVALALGFIGYLRPGELERLTGLQIIRPPHTSAAYQRWGILLHPSENEGNPGKTGLWDEAVMLDCCDWLMPALEALKIPLSSQRDRVWPFPTGHLQNVFGRAVNYVGMN